MKNIVKVLRYKDNAKRIYALPEGINVKVGTMVRVEFPDSLNTCDGVAVSDSYEVDEATATMVAVFHHIPGDTLDNLKRVTSIYEEHVVEWPADEEAEEAEADEEEEA